MKLAAEGAWECKFDKLCIPQMGLILQNQHSLANVPVGRNSTSHVFRVHSETSTWKSNPCLQAPTSPISLKTHF